MKQTIKLLVDAHCFDYDTSEGMNTYVRGLYTELVKISPEIDFYFVAYNTEKLQSVFGTATNIHYIKIGSRSKVYRLLFEIPVIIKQYGIDAAHFQYTSPLIKNCRTIVTLHDILFKDYPHLFPWQYRISKNVLFGLSAKRADLLLTVSEYSRRQISKHFNIPIERISVTPNAVSEDFFLINKDATSEFVRKNGIEKYLLYVSRFEPRKNHVTLLKAYCELQLWQEGYDLVLIGRKTIATSAFDEYYNGLEDNVKKRIHILNQVSYSELKYWYKGASLFVYPALAEGFGIPPIEAGAAGTPVLCNKHTAMEDFTMFEDGLFDFIDFDNLKEMIKSALLSAQNKLLSVHIQRQIAEKYNWSSIAAHFKNSILYMLYSDYQMNTEWGGYNKPPKPKE